MKWRGRPLEYWLDRAKGEKKAGKMTSNAKCTVCDLAWAMGLSEKEFYENHSERYDREQLMATYNSQNNRAFVTSAYPAPSRKK